MRDNNIIQCLVSNKTIIIALTLVEYKFKIADLVPHTLSAI